MAHVQVDGTDVPSDSHIFFNVLFARIADLTFGLNERSYYYCIQSTGWL